MMNRAGLDLGGAALLLVRRHRGGVVVRRAGLRPGRRPPLGADRAAGRARRARALAAAADHGPRAARALLQHAADLQAALADVDGRVVPDAVRQRSRAAAVGADLLGPRREARALGAANAVVGGYLGSYTGVLLAVDRRARSGRAARLFLGPIFVTTATATGAATCRLTLVARGLPAGHPTRHALGASRPPRWRPSCCCRSSTSAGLGPLASGLTTGRRGDCSRPPSGPCGAGWRCGSPGGAAGRPPSTSRAALYLAAGLLFRYAWVKAGQAPPATTGRWRKWRGRAGTGTEARAAYSGAASAGGSPQPRRTAVTRSSASSPISRCSGAIC